MQAILHKATFLDPRFKLDYVEGVDRQILEDSILDEGIQIVTSTPTTLQTSQEGEKSLPVSKKKRLVTFLKKSSDSGLSVSVA